MEAWWPNIPGLSPTWALGVVGKLSKLLSWVQPASRHPKSVYFWTTEVSSAHKEVTTTNKPVPCARAGHRGKSSWEAVRKGGIELDRVIPGFLQLRWCGLVPAVVEESVVSLRSPLPVPLEEVWVRSVLLSLEGDVCCGAWCTWIAWTGTC